MIIRPSCRYAGHRLFLDVCLAIAGLLVPALADAQGTVTAKTRDTVTLSVGARDGVQVGMRGEVLTTMQAGGKEQTFAIATFEVTGVQERTSSAKLLQVGQNFQVGRGMTIRMLRPLVKPEPAERAKPRATPTPRVPADPAEILRQGNAAWDRQDWARAAEMYEALLQAVPGHPIAAERAPIARRNVEEARRAAEQARQQAEQQAQAAREAREAAERERKNLPLYRETARTYLEANQWDKAAEWLKKVAAVDPNDAYLWSVLDAKRRQAETALAAKRYDEAIAACDAVLAVGSDAATSQLRERAKQAQLGGWLAEGDAALARGDVTAARAAWAKVKSADPSFPGLKERLDKLDWVRIPAGTFQMGCVPGDSQCDDDESPRHAVAMTRGFWMMTNLVTVAGYRAYSEATGHGLPGQPDWNGDDHPVVNVSWDDAVAYCTWAGGRLPTEAEWEDAARGGKDGLIYPWGSEISPDNANYSGTGGRDQWMNTSPVGSFEANGFGLFDMAGNVWEWCADWYGSNYYGSSPVADPKGPSSESGRVLRGGSWGDYPRRLRTSYRTSVGPSGRSFNFFGFRCVRDADSP